MYPKYQKFLWYLSFICLIVFVTTILILGFITPNYNHFHDTISLLSIKKYAFIQQINFIQFGISLIIFAFIFLQQLTKASSKTIWIRIVSFCLLFLTIITTFRADETHGIPTLDKFTLYGKIHIVTLLIFFILAPFGVHLLAKMVKSESKLSHLSRLTSVSGYTAAILCYIWTYFYINNCLDGYMGLFQKIIALIIIYWLLRLHLAIRDTHKQELAKY